MSEVELGQVELQSDPEGFISRQCPTCQRVFKLSVARLKADDASPVAYCPYCRTPNADDWYTDDQQAFLHAAIQRAAMQWVSGQFGEMLGDSQGSGMEVSQGEHELPPEPAGPPAEETEGFTVVDVPCHPDDPFKITSETTGEVACPICGIPYEVTDVARLGGG